MKIDDNQFEALQKIAERIHKPVYLCNQHGRILCNSHTMITSPDWIRILPFFQRRTPHYFSMIYAKQTFSVFPIDLTEQTCEYVVIPSFIPPLDETLQVFIAQAVNEISIARMRQYTAQQTAKRARNEGFRRWIEGASYSQQDAAYIAKTFGLNVENSYLCMICQLDHCHETTHFLNQQLMLDQVVDLLDSALPTSPFPSFLFVKGDMGIVLMEETGSWSEMSGRLLSFLKQLQMLVSIQANHTISFGVSLTSCRTTHLSEGYSEALEALQAGHLSSQAEYIQFYQAKDVPDLLKLIPRKDLVTFHQMHLHPLYEAGQNLLHTLSVYLETHCHISETAKRLSIHRNTVIYRLEKCEELLRISLKDPEATLRLRLALRIQMLLSPHPD
ncbi:PucR family transcriptional regulator [Bacillus pumilus]|jgi:purine catabolism regulator|uniref:PucR family transcriptional regulator n=1 Tax=Bacillus pumilus TaxID=1408 RepID=UPI00081FF4BC|nr:helix-turn-helix domain-containing protein [Bacillus pumilus]AOC55543.1 transcriptional regulator [Bacillus pumilus]MBR0587252.1 PucR family transcriptional regulator [Bacillus pumilus DW2J2]MBR0617463.1 PucR family transcriptional regulator [Bacillus pumilus]MBR0624997.1 PucR family transcriptional regulator [Bacillus pumilus]MCY7723760.1 helix-turn-helix domain-containing protein [Bacillus pumilus]